MAEVLGAVASGLAVQQTAGEITKTLFKLRELYEQIKDAPEKIQDLLADIESFTALLAEMEGQLAEGSTTAHQSVQLCRNALSQLEKVTSELQIRLCSPKRSKRLIGGLKVVLCHDELKRYEDKLERAFRLLQMSHQCYIAASTKALPEVIAERMTVELLRYQQVKQTTVQESSLTAAVEELPDAVAEENNQMAHQYRDRGKPASQNNAALAVRRKQTCQASSSWSLLGNLLVVQSSRDSNFYQISVQPPLIQRIWNMQATRTYGGWQYVFRQRGIISQKMMDCIKRDDDNGLLRLFESREGSPYDVIHGESVFIVRLILILSYSGLRLWTTIRLESYADLHLKSSSGLWGMPNTELPPCY